MTFDVFDVLVSREFEAPARRARQAAALNQARTEVDRRFGDFLRQASDDEEFYARCGLVAADMQPIWNHYGLNAQAQKSVVDSLKVSDTWKDPAHKSDNCCTDEPLQNPATTMPWGEAGPTPKQVKGEDDENDATLRHVSSWFGLENPVSGMDLGDEVMVNRDVNDVLSGQPLSSGDRGTVQDINGSDVTLNIDGYDVVVEVQDLERVASKREAIAPLVAPLMRAVAPMMMGEMLSGGDDEEQQQAPPVDPGAPTTLARRRQALAPLVAPVLRQTVPKAIDTMGDMFSNDAAGDGGFGEGAADIVGGLNEGLQETFTGNPVEGIQDAVGGFTDAFGGDDQSDMAPDPGPAEMALDMGRDLLNGGGSGTQPIDPAGVPGIKPMMKGIPPEGDLLNKNSSAEWTWDSESNAFKSSRTSTFRCACGQVFSGVGQHRCACGKTWNMFSVMNGSKTAQDFPIYSCREVHTDDRLVLAGSGAGEANYYGCLDCDGNGYHDGRRCNTCQGSGVVKDSRRRADVQNNGTGNDPAKGGPGGNEDPPQPDLTMRPDESHNQPDYIERGKGARVARQLQADAGLWPLLDDKDIQANWKSLMGIILNPSQVGALEHEQYQQLIQELYEEITRRGLDSPADANQMMDPGMQFPGGGIPAPSPTALAYRRMGYNAALAGVAPSFDEPMECFQGYVLGLNQKIADSYSERSTEFEGSEPVRPGELQNNDSLIPGQNISDPTPSQRRDFADDTDDRNEQGESDKETANHVEDFKPETETHT